MPNIIEPNISINNIVLSKAQSMTMRVALTSFQIHLNDDGLGDDKTGKQICKNYLERIDEINKIIFGEN